jgi:hypothetical protein
MSKFGGSVSYKNNKINDIEINKNIIARIEMLSQNIAKIYFVNDKGVSIQVPMGMVLRDISSDNSIIQHGVYNGTESYMITWFSNYVMYWNGKEVFSLINQKQQAIKIPKSLYSDGQRTLYDFWNTE